MHNQSTTPTISVIVPVYNAEKYLRRCIDSVLAQTYTDFELLLIDDGSKDKSGEICDEYAQKDARVRVFHKENGGVSSARNLGLDNAKGEWITFVDSDDWAKPYYIEHLVASIDGADLVVAYATICKKDENAVEEHYQACRVLSDNFSILFTKNAMSWHTSPWSKLYNTQIIQTNDLRFEEDVRIGEDAIFLYTYMLLTKVINIVSYTDYCYQSEVGGSLTKRINSFESEWNGMQKIIAVVNRMVRERKLSDKAKTELQWLKASYMNRVLNSLYCNGVSRKQRIEVLKSLDLDCYVHNIYPDTIRFKMYVFLLKHRLLGLYDLCRYTIKLTK